jgi:hypothetical protein
MKCPKCNNEMVKHSKKQYFVTMLLTGLIIWPMLLFLPFVGLMPVKYKCKPCKKFYKEKDLKLNS